jgi:hypothetical protein
MGLKPQHLEAMEFHHLHCCVGSLELGAMAYGQGAFSERQLRTMLASMRADCPTCWARGWTGWEAFD